MLIRHKREAPGTILLASVICIPLLSLIVGSKWQSPVRIAQSRQDTAVGPTIAAPPSIPEKAPDVSTVPGLTLNPEPSEAASASEPPGLPNSIAGVPPPSPTPGDADSAQKLGTLPAVSTGSLPASTSTSPSASPEEVPPSGDVLSIHNDAFVIMKGAEGSGSGFICHQGNQTWLFTNIHVIADIKQPTMTRLDNGTVTPGAAEAAVGEDIARFAIAQSPPHPLEAITEFESNVRIGDEVMVLGNSGGGGVVTQLKGTIVGIGPDRIEVSAEFIPGNSGSPIIHVKTGKVVGIATYLTKRRDQFATGSTG